MARQGVAPILLEIVHAPVGILPGVLVLVSDAAWAHWRRSWCRRRCRFQTSIPSSEYSHPEPSSRRESGLRPRRCCLPRRAPVCQQSVDDDELVTCILHSIAGHRVRRLADNLLVDSLAGKTCSNCSIPSAAFLPKPLSRACAKVGSNPTAIAVRHTRRTRRFIVYSFWDGRSPVVSLTEF